MTLSSQLKETIFTLAVALLLTQVVWSQQRRDYGRLAEAAESNNVSRMQTLLGDWIENNADDAARRLLKNGEYDVAGKKKLSQAAIIRGKRQLRLMMSARPAMKTHVSSEIQAWAIRQFAGERVPFRVFWDPRVPTQSLNAEHEYALADNGDIQLVRIRVSSFHQYGERKGTALSHEELWAAIVFELYNIRNWKGFVGIEKVAMAQAIDRGDYVRVNFRLEHKAIQKTRGFYCYRFLPFVAKVGIRTDPAVWYAGTWGGAKEWLKVYGDKSEYPWSYYGGRFDRIQMALRDRR